MNSEKKRHLSEQELQRARQLYHDARGSMFFMDRGSEGQEYRGYGISRRQEKQWVQEFLAETWDELQQATDMNDICTCVHCATSFLAISNKPKGQYLIKLMAYAERNFSKWDTLTNIVAAESLCATAKKLRFWLKITGKTRREVSRFAIETMRRVLNNPIFTAPEHQWLLQLGNACAPETLRQRATENLATWSKKRQTA